MSSSSFFSQFTRTTFWSKATQPRGSSSLLNSLHLPQNTGLTLDSWGRGWRNTKSFWRKITRQQASENRCRMQTGRRILLTTHQKYNSTNLQDWNHKITSWQVQASLLAKFKRAIKQNDKASRLRSWQTGTPEIFKISLRIHHSVWWMKHSGVSGKTAYKSTCSGRAAMFTSLLLCLLSSNWLCESSFISLKIFPQGHRFWLFQQAKLLKSLSIFKKQMLPCNRTSIQYLKRPWHDTAKQADLRFVYNRKMRYRRA